MSQSTIAVSRDTIIEPKVKVTALSGTQRVLFTVVAAAAFHVAYGFPALSFMIVVYLYGALRLAEAATARQAFYSGLILGYAVYPPHLGFFWSVFGPPAVALWTVLAFWLGLFVALARMSRIRFGKWSLLLIPVLWTGLEYFRSELYYLRFSWLNVGYAFADAPHVVGATRLGVYGIAFGLLVVVGAISLAPANRRLLALSGCTLAFGVFTCFPPNRNESFQGQAVSTAGVQLEFPAPFEVPSALDKLSEKQPGAELLVLSEYTFDGPVSERVKSWCRQRRKHLVAGGKEFISTTDFDNTAFVVNPEGQIVFSQVKSVPIQFFKDGRAAKVQKLWESPWGRVGLLICYDLSYRRVADELIRQGAQALIVPTMDLEGWGAYQHALHARVAPVRAAEFGVPIFRLCSSGISQLVDCHGQVRATAPFPGQGDAIGGTLHLMQPGRLPIDHWLAPFCVLISAALVLWFWIDALRGKITTP